MNRREAERLAHQQNALLSLGFTRDEAEALRRISMTLQRWHELECGDANGCIERDEETGRPFYTVWGANGCRSRWPTADREAGAKKRLAAILKARNDRAFSAVQGSMQGSAPQEYREPDLTAFIQGDPRGAALYILRPGDVPEGKPAEAYYNRGICVY